MIHSELQSRYKVTTEHLTSCVFVLLTSKKVTKIQWLLWIISHFVVSGTLWANGNQQNKVLNSKIQIVKRCGRNEKKAGGCPCFYRWGARCSWWEGKSNKDQSVRSGLSTANVDTSRKQILEKNTPNERFGDSIETSGRRSIPHTRWSSFW